MNLQTVRLLDVFMIGPVLIFLGLYLKNIPMWARLILIGIGIGTVLFNGNNYLKYK